MIEESLRSQFGGFDGPVPVSIDADQRVPEDAFRISLFTVTGFSPAYICDPKRLESGTCRLVDLRPHLVYSCRLLPGELYDVISVHRRVVVIPHPNCSHIVRLQEHDGTEAGEVDPPLIAIIAAQIS